MKRKRDLGILIALIIVFILTFPTIRLFFQGLKLKNEYNSFLNNLSESVASTNGRGVFVYYNDKTYKIDNYNAENYYRLLYVAKQGKVVDVKELDKSYYINYVDGSSISFTKIDKTYDEEYMNQSGVLVVYKDKDDKYYSYITDNLLFSNLEYILLYSGGAKEIGK